LKNALTAAWLTLVVGAAGAAAQPSPATGETRWSLGLGVFSAPRPYVGADNQTRAIPLLDLEYKRFYFRGILAGVQLLASERFTLDVVGRAQFAGFEEKDSIFLAGMEERRETFELGLAASWRLGAFELEAGAFADVLGRSDGVQANLELTWKRIFGRGAFGLFPGIGVVWQSSEFVDYYAGVRPQEALPGRPAFEGSSALNFGAGLQSFARLTERARLVGLARVQQLAGGYEDSPIIADRWTYFGLLGVAYQL
jgi:outer membrane protein